MNIGVDLGGTFTDLVASGDEGASVTGKVLNSSDGPAVSVAEALESVELRDSDVGMFTHGTTLVTNLLIERMGARVGLICSRGFRDVLEIQHSYRQFPFALSYAKTPPFVPRQLRRDIGGRISHLGVEVEPVDELEVRAAVDELRRNGAEVIAVALYNAYANPIQERQVERVVADTAPDMYVSTSSAVDARIGEFERTSTAVLNASVLPRVARYMHALSRARIEPTHYMQSAGGAVSPTEAALRPIQLALSGPAAGVVAAREVGRALGHDSVITMDMGGTSCDVSVVIDGELRYRDELWIDWGTPARVRALDIKTIGAGGGSIAWHDSGGALQVGPRSAAARPGPASYGRGGKEATVTDANVALGILPDRLLGGEVPISRKLAIDALGRVGRFFAMTPEACAAAIHKIVNANMAQAIRELTVQRGIDPRMCALVAFGGAGPQHAAGVATEVGIHTVIVPAFGGVLSAVGLLTADLRVASSRTILLALERLAGREAGSMFNELERDALDRLGVADSTVTVQRLGGLRYVGQSHEVTLPLDGSIKDIAELFENEHERRFGTRLAQPIEVVDAWVEATMTRLQKVDFSKQRQIGARRTARTVALVGTEVPVFQREGLPASSNGACLVEERDSVTFVPADWTVAPQREHLVLEQVAR